VKLKNSSATNVTVALIHHPVVDKNGKTIAAAVTALDLHDIARSAKTYGAGAFYVVTPLEDQQELVRRIIGHWVTGVGAQYNPDRQAALSLIRLQPSLEAMLRELENEHGARPRVIATSARNSGAGLSYPDLASLAREHRPIVLLFGTAWGLADEIMDAADHRLAPINGHGDYNHLAVRSAVAIILDRLLGRTN
jgi:hypothetical protein